MTEVDNLGATMDGVVVMGAWRTHGVAVGRGGIEDEVTLLKPGETEASALARAARRLAERTVRGAVHCAEVCPSSAQL